MRKKENNVKHEIHTRISDVAYVRLKMICQMYDFTIAKMLEDMILGIDVQEEHAIEKLVKEMVYVSELISKLFDELIIEGYMTESLEDQFKLSLIHLEALWQSIALTLQKNQ